MVFRTPDHDRSASAAEAETPHRSLGTVGGMPAAELIVRGTLDIESADAFRQTYTRLLDSGVARFFVDLGDVGYIDSTGLGSLMQLYRQAKERGGGARFYNVTPSVMDIFSLTHLDKVIEIDEDRQAALSKVNET